MLCEYGCGQEAQFKTKGHGKKVLARHCCSKSPNSCPAVRKKNSDKIKQAHADKRCSCFKGANRGWAKGLTKDTDERIEKLSKALVGKTRIGHPHTEESKEKLRQHRLQKLLEGKYDTSGRKGHRGYFDSQFFHSSWELAFYVWNKEVLNRILIKNYSVILEYDYLNKRRKYIPDFIDENGNLFEIKGYIFSERDKTKINSAIGKVTTLFKADIDVCLDFCKMKYGRKFWEVLYNQNGPVVQPERHASFKN